MLETITRLWIQFDQRTLCSWCWCKWLPGSRWWLWLLLGCSLLAERSELNKSSTWPLITSCCFDRVCACVCVFWLYVCFLKATGGSQLVFMEAASRVKCLVQAGLASCRASSPSHCFIIHRHTALARPNGCNRSGGYSTAGVRCAFPPLMSPLVYLKAALQLPRRLFL